MHAPLRALQGQRRLEQRSTRQAGGELDDPEIGGEVAARDRLPLVLELQRRPAPLLARGLEARAELVGREHAGREHLLALVGARDRRIDAAHVDEGIVAREPELRRHDQAVPAGVVDPQVAEHGEAVAIVAGEIWREAEGEQCE